MKFAWNQRMKQNSYKFWFRSQTETHKKRKHLKLDNKVSIHSFDTKVGLIDIENENFLKFDNRANGYNFR